MQDVARHKNGTAKRHLTRMPIFESSVQYIPCIIELILLQKTKKYVNLGFLIQGALYVN